MTSEHDKVTLLLPWYVNGTLASEERDAVAAHLENCTNCQQDLVLLREMSDVVQGTQPVPIVPPPPVKQFLAEVDATTAAPEIRMRRTGWLLAASLVVASIMLGRVVMTGPENASPTFFEPATSAAGEAGMYYVLEIQFNPAMETVERQRMLARIGVADVSVTEQPDTIRGVVSLPALSLAELERYTQDMESVAGILRADVIALQLPVEVAQ